MPVIFGFHLMPLNQQQGTKRKEKALVDSAHTLLVSELEPCAPWHGFHRLLGQIGSSGICLDRAGDLAGI